MLPDSSRNLITAVSEQCSLSMRRGRLSRAAHLLLNISFYTFSHSEFVYNTAIVYFT